VLYYSEKGAILLGKGCYISLQVYDIKKKKMC
jgi:hypothetical protein